MSKIDLGRMTGLLDRYAVQIDQARILSLLELLALRAHGDDEAVPSALSLALDTLEAEAWDGAEAGLRLFAEGDDAAPSLVAAVDAGLAAARPSRPAAEGWPGFRERLADVKVVMQSWVALGASDELERVTAALDERTGEDGAEAPPAIDDLDESEDGLSPPQFEINIGLDLVPRVNEDAGGTLVPRIRRLRGQMSARFGFGVSPIHLRDDLRLAPAQYRLLLRGQEVAAGGLMVDHVLAIDPGDASGRLEGVATREPAFGLPAYWIAPEITKTAQAKGYTVVDPDTVLATHLGEVMQAHVETLFGWEELQAYLDAIEGWAPGIVAEIVPGKLARTTVHRVLRNLLHEGIGIGDARTILESLDQGVDRWTHPDGLTELVRKALARQVVAAATPGEDDVPALRLASDLVAVLEAGFDVGETGALRLVGLAAAIDAVCGGVASAQRRLGGVELIVISPPLIRGPLRRGLHGRLHPLPAFLAEDEVDSSVPIRSVGLVSLAGKFVPEAPAGD